MTRTAWRKIDIRRWHRTPSTAALFSELAGPIDRAKANRSPELSVRGSLHQRNENGMKNSSKANRIVSQSPADIPPSAQERLTRLKAAMNGPIDTSDIPEAKKPGVPVQRD